MNCRLQLKFLFARVFVTSCTSFDHFGVTQMQIVCQVQMISKVYQDLQTTHVGDIDVDFQGLTATFDLCLQ